MPRFSGILDKVDASSVQFHALPTARLGSVPSPSLHVLVPGDWTVQRGHDLLERIEATLRDTVPELVAFTHLEPLDDPASQAEEGLDRAAGTGSGSVDAA